MPLYSEQQRRALEVLGLVGLEEYHTLLRSLGEFLEAEVLPAAAHIDRSARFPRESLDKTFRQGVMALSLPPEYGGLGLPLPVYIAALELVAKACASTAISLSIHGTVCEGIRQFAGATLRRAYLPDLLAGRKLGAFALTEPASGSDARAMQTTAAPDGDSYRLNGSKMFITNGGVADVYFVFARTERRHTAFLVPSDTPGLQVGADIQKLGLRGSRTAPVTLTDCRVPRDYIVGREGEGFEYAKQMLYGGRITAAANAIGIAEAAYAKALQYSRDRKQFGQRLAKFQMIQEKLASILTELNAARLLTYSAALLKHKGLDFASESAQAKVFASEMALRACDAAIQIHGGYGYSDEYDIHRHWRDARLWTIGEGTSEILRLLIAREALGVAN